MNSRLPEKSEYTMDSDYDIKIKSLFDQARADIPDEVFTRQVMLTIRHQERKARLYLLACLTAVILFAWIMAPELEQLVFSLNGFVEFSTEMLIPKITDLSLSPVTWACLAPAVAYLYRNRFRLI